MEEGQIEFIKEEAIPILQQKGYSVNQKKISNGSFGVVFLIKDKNGADLAAKVISLKHPSEQIDIKLLQNAQFEARIMRENQHDNIVILLDSFQEGRLFFFIMEQAQMTLEDYEKNIKLSEENLSEEEILNFASQMVEGILFMHSKNIVLRDMKPSNVLLFKNRKLKLSDFGMCKQFISMADINAYKQSSIKGTYFYLPPEIMKIFNDQKTSDSFLKSNPIKSTFKGDVWAFGISLLSLLGYPEYLQLGLSHGNTTFSNFPQASEKVNNFLRQILQQDIEKRPTISSVKKFLREISPQYNAQCYIEEGIILRDKELNFDEANELFKLSIKEDSDNSMAYFNLALSYFRSNYNKNLDESIKQNLNMALSLNPKNENAIGLQSQLSEHARNKQNLLKTAFEENQFNPYILNLLGAYYQETDNYEEAEKFFNLAIKYNKNFGRAYYFLGKLYGESGKFEDALRVFKLGIGRDYSDSAFFTEIGKIYYLDLNDSKNGQQYLEIAVRSNQRDIIAKYCLSIFYKQNNQFEQALELSQELVKLIPSQDYYNELHDVLMILGRHEECEQYDLQAANVNKKFNSYLNLAEVSAKLSNKNVCIESMNKALELEPESGEGYLAYGHFLEQNYDWKGALEKFQRALSLKEDCQTDIDRVEKNISAKEQQEFKLLKQKKK